MTSNRAELVAAERKAQRDATQLEFRTPLALEQIADTLEAIRVTLVKMESAMEAQLRAESRKSSFAPGR